MPGYEYKVIPAPKKAGKIKGLKGPELNFAAALAEIMNRLGRDGWEYQRTDTLPCEQRQGFTGRVTVFQNMLIFRKKIDDPVEMPVRNPTPEPALQPAAEPALAVPAFRSTAAEGTVPRLGTARAADPAKPAAAPSIAAQ